MPELPEVQTVVNQLRPRVVGARIDQAESKDPRIPARGWKALAGRTVLDIERMGKRIVFHLAPIGRTGALKDEPLDSELPHDAPMFLGIHLRMTGRLIWKPSLPRGAPEPTHVRATFATDRGELLFCDLRRFGTIDAHADRGAFLPAGIEPLSNEFTFERLAESLSRRRVPIKNWLLRQDGITGLGNIYASEILFDAGISPFDPANSLDHAQISGLRRSVIAVLAKAIECCGTTFSDFQDARGLEGEFGLCLNVYGRGERPCRVCGHRIERVKQGGRSTFFCPRCQRGR